MTTLFLATCGLACGIYLFVLVRLRREKARGRMKVPGQNLRVVEFRKPPVRKSERAKTA